MNLRGLLFLFLKYRLNLEKLYTSKRGGGGVGLQEVLLFLFSAFANDYKNITCKIGATFVIIIEKLRIFAFHKMKHHQ